MDADNRGKPGYTPVKYTEQEVKWLNEFSHEVGKQLDFKLNLVSLTLIGIGTHQVSEGQYQLVAHVGRPSTGETIELAKKMVMELGHTSSSTIEPFVQSITEELIEYFFKESGPIITV